MGQQQILMLVLAVCIIGTVASVGVISMQQELIPNGRDVLIEDLQALAREARMFYHRPAHLNGGGGSFLLLTAVPHSITRLTPTPHSPRGEYYIRTTGRAKSVEIVGIGLQPGIDKRLPMRASITVWPDMEEVRILN